MTSNQEFLIKQWEQEEEIRRGAESTKWFLVMFLCLMMILGIGLYGIH